MQIDINRFKGQKIFVLGDMMIDEYIWGVVDRISPEAPVQIVSIKKVDYTLGGAGNVVNNLAALGADVSAAGVIGAGIDGQRLIKKFLALGVNTDSIIVEKERPTTRKTRIIAANQHVLRIDRETKKEISKKTFEKIIENVKNKIPHVNTLLISDYNKGLMTRELLSRILQIAKDHHKITIVDPKGLDFSKYSGATIITPNSKEATLAAGIEMEEESGILKAGELLLSDLNIEKLLITCGKDGMILFEMNKTVQTIKAKARQVFDVSGAGDTVLAVLGLALAAGASFKEGAFLSNIAAGIVVGKIGTATVSINELKEALA